MKSDIVLVTGSCGFIGYHLCSLLLSKGYQVIGVDNLDPYYDVTLKQRRNSKLLNNSGYEFHELDIANPNFLDELSEINLDIIVHLAAQAGVRYSIERPEKYVQSNLVGTSQILELAKRKEVSHLMLASTSSAYGANRDMPFNELEKCSHPLSFYAATKQSTELLAHSYSHLFKIPTTAFRFFTVYGPWGRPDMALFKFSEAIMHNRPIDVYNYGNMKRDFTYIDDLVEAIDKLKDVPPQEIEGNISNSDSLSPVAPMRVVNIGNSSPVELMDYIHALESALGKKADINFMPLQAGDVTETYANVNLLFELTGFRPNTSVNEGVRNFVEWYLSEYFDSKGQL